ncbi:MAG: ATP-binding protein [Bacteroidetes bacterium]|nr:ATP-binding protein [Bacteroidota bacterium]
MKAGFTDNKWPKSITVDRRIVKILSESTYENFPTALKEIITNSYDADASEVKIDVDLAKDTLTIIDNGKGMSEEEFDFFIRIAGSKREKDKKTTASGRFIVGKFGVGFLSIFPYFKNYNIESTKRGSEKVLTSSIPCYKYFDSGKLVEVSEIPIQGGTRIDKSKLNESYTKITLSGLTDLARQFFFPKKEKKHRRNTVLSYNSIDKLKWRLEEDLPIEYEDSRFNILIKKYSPHLPFKVILNSAVLKRRTFGQQILEINKKEVIFNKIYGEEQLEVNDNQWSQIGKIKFQYFILTNKTAVHPYEGRAIKRRNLNVGVGERTAYGLGSEVKGGRSRLQWLTGEVLVFDGLNDMINVQRTDFYYDSDYEELKEFVIERLSHHSNQLEREAEYYNEQNESKIKNLSLIEEETEEFEEEDEQAVYEEKRTQKLSNNKPTKRPAKANEDKISKKIQIGNKNYAVKVSKWDYKNELFPACKIEKDTLIINQSYPLFKGVKHTDVFIRLHALLVLNYNDKSLNKGTYSKLTAQIIDLYNNYI